MMSVALGQIHACTQGRVMLKLQQRGWTLREIGDVWGVGRQYVYWLIGIARRGTGG
jgi:hypothetical protein